MKCGSHCCRRLPARPRRRRRRGGLDRHRTASGVSQRHIRVLITGLARGQIPLTHQGLAARPDWRSAIYLRDLLVSCGVLPATDRQLADYEGWLHRRLSQLAGHPHQRLLRQFGLWHQLPKMRARAAAAPLQASARKYAEQRFIQAENFLTWTTTTGRQPASLTQDDIDTWHATHPSTPGKAPAAS